MKAILFSGLIVVMLLAGCQTANATEWRQQQDGVKAILNNQPVPDLGGWSSERQILIDTYIARNKMINTYTYMFLEFTGQVVKICDSKGFPIPYSTQLTNPSQVSGGTTVGNPEPNSLYSPESSAATLVQCILPDGKVAPTYWENNVFSLPYQIKADKILTPLGDSSFSTGVK